MRPLGVILMSLPCRLYTGDTESFRLAFHLAGKGADYAQAPHRPAVALSAQQVRRRLTKVAVKPPAHNSAHSLWTY